MDFRLTNDEMALREMFRDFADKEVRPYAMEIDETEVFPVKIKDKMAELGFLGLIVPERYGGSGGSHLSYAILVEELAKASAAVALIVSGANCNMCGPILAHGTEEQKQKYIRQLATGKKIGAFVLTEPGSGSDAGGMRSKAVEEGDYFVLNGTKTFISNAEYGDYFISFVLTEGADGKREHTSFIIERDFPGFYIGKHEKKMGTRGIDLCELIFDNCMIPKENMLGKRGEGMKVALSTLDAGRIGIAALSVGRAQEAIDLAAKYTKERTQFGKRISQFQNTQFKLAELQTQVTAARLLVYNAAWALDHGEPATQLASMAKYYASDVVNVAARQCLQFFGGYGYIKEYPIERIYRDAKITEIFEGTSEIQKLVISRSMGIN